MASVTNFPELNPYNDMTLEEILQQNPVGIDRHFFILSPSGDYLCETEEESRESKRSLWDGYGMQCYTPFVTVASLLKDLSNEDMSTCPYIMTWGLPLYLWQATSIPDFGFTHIRLDDRCCFEVMKPLASADGDMASMTASLKSLHERYPLEFGPDGLLQRNRLPLGCAAKVHKVAGDVDSDGHVLLKGQDGWFFVSQFGIHQLCGNV